jgi:hypothetical protein
MEKNNHLLHLYEERDRSKFRLFTNNWLKLETHILYACNKIVPFPAFLFLIKRNPLL